MKFKRIMLVTMVLLVILTISAVSATDDADNLTATKSGGSLDIVESPSQDSEIISESSDTDDIGAALKVSSPDSGGNGADFNWDNIVGNNTEDEGDENDDDIKLWVNTESEFSTAPEDLPEIFASVKVPEGTEGNVTFICDKGILYNLALSDFMDGRIDRENNTYNIALEADGKFIFGDLNDGDWFKFAFLDKNGDEIRGRDYHIFFGNNTVRFEVDAHNPGDHVSIDVNDDVNINDDDDFVWINLPSNVTEGKVMVTSGNFTLFEESVNFDNGTHWWIEIDGHYVCSFPPTSLTNWDKLNTGNIVTFAFLDGEDQMVESKDYKVTVEGNNVRFEESKYIDVGIWGSDEMGTLYTDTPYNDIVWVNVPEDVYGSISVIVNGEERDTWGIEYEDGEDWAHHEWGLMDLGIFDEGDYNVTVKHDDEILREAMLHVVKDNKDRFRTAFILDRIRLFCPDNVTGTVRITFKGQDDEGNIYPAADDFIYEIAPEDSGIWIEWTTDDLGIELYNYYMVSVIVEDDDGNPVYNETRWHEFALYPEYESRILYLGNTEIIDRDNFQWGKYNRIRYYHELGETSIVSIYISNDDYDRDAVPNMTIDYTNLPTGYYYISLNDIGITDVGEYYITADCHWGDLDDGFDEYITVYEPQTVTGISGHSISGDFDLTIDILPVRTIITGNVYDDYVITLEGIQAVDARYTIDIVGEGTSWSRTFGSDDFTTYGQKAIIGSKDLGINKEGTYRITVHYSGGGYFIDCSGTIRYLSSVNVDLSLYNMHSSELYVGYGLDDNEYITFRHREEGHLDDIEGNVSVYINGKLDKTFNIKSLPKEGGQPENMYYFIPLSMLGEIPVGNNTITVIYEGNQPAVEKTQNFTAVMLTVEKFFEYTTIDFTEDVYSDQVNPVRIYFSGNPMSAYPLVWGKLILYVNGEKINKTMAVFHEGVGNPSEVYGIYDETDPEAIELMDKIKRNELEGWHCDRFDWLNLVYLEWYCDYGLRYLTLDDLNITSEGVYNITLNYFGHDEVWNPHPDYDSYGGELRIISQNIKYTKDNTHMKVVITPENKYAINTPSLINFELGNDYWNSSTERTYNNVVVYINNTLAFNDTLVRYTYGDWDAQIKIFGGASSNCLSGDLLNEFDCLDEGNYHAVVYMEDGGKLTEIGSGDFAVIKQRGNMSFRVDTEVDLGEHAYVYADIPQSLMDDYWMVLRITVDYEDIEIDISNVVGKGEVPIDLGVLRSGSHVVYVELAPDTNMEDFYNVSKNFFNNYFKVNVLKASSSVAIDVESEFIIGDEITITITNSTACVVTVNNITYEVKGGKVVIDSAELGAGTYEVIATIAEDEFFTGSSANATFTVSLIDTSINVDNDTFELMIGQNRTIIAVSLPDGLKVSFDTDDDSVVSVDENGNVVALSAGNAIIHVSVGDNVIYKYSSVAVNVTVGKIPTEIVLENESLDLYTFDHVEDAASLKPADAGNLTFVSSDENVVSIIYGMIFANGTGTATVTVSFAGDNKYAAAKSKTITVNVKLKDASVSVENDTLNLKVNERYDLNATTVPGFLNVEYVSSNESVATVTDYGIVTAVGEGTAVITLTVGNDITYAINSTSITVKVSKLPSEIITVNDSLDLVVGDEVGAPASLIPSDAGDLTYVISNEDAVKIVNGTIVAVGAGNATVTYSFAGNGDYAAAESKTIAVTVSAIETVINVSKASYELNVGDSDVIAVVTIPEGLKVDFDSFNSSVVSVDSDGKIVAVGEGKTVIYIGFGDNVVYKYAFITVNVTVSKVEIPIGKDTFNFDENEVVKSKTPTYSIKLPSDATGTLTVTIGNKIYTADVVKGAATVVVKNLPAGNYNGTVVYSGDNKYAPIVKTSKVSVTVDPRITAKDLTVQHTAGKYYSVTVYGDDGKVASGARVVFYLKGSKVATKTTNKNGVAKFKVTQAPVSKAKIKIVALGKTVIKKLTIKRVVSIKSVTVKKTSKKIVLKATLAKVNGKYFKGKKITFKFNGIKFKAVKTNSKGVASLTITSKKYKTVFTKLSKIKKGKKITYSATYSGDTVKKTTKLK